MEKPQTAINIKIFNCDDLIEKTISPIDKNRLAAGSAFAALERNRLCNTVDSITNLMFCIAEEMKQMKENAESDRLGKEIEEWCVEMQVLFAEGSGDGRYLCQVCALEMKERKRLNLHVKIMHAGPIRDFFLLTCPLCEPASKDYVLKKSMEKGAFRTHLLEKHESLFYLLRQDLRRDFAEKLLNSGNAYLLMRNVLNIIFDEGEIKKLLERVKAGIINFAVMRMFCGMTAENRDEQMAEIKALIKTVSCGADAKFCPYMRISCRSADNYLTYKKDIRNAERATSLIKHIEHIYFMHMGLICFFVRETGSILGKMVRENRERLNSGYIAILSMSAAGRLRYLYEKEDLGELQFIALKYFGTADFWSLPSLLMKNRIEAMKFHSCCNFCLIKIINLDEVHQLEIEDIKEYGDRQVVKKRIENQDCEDAVNLTNHFLNAEKFHEKQKNRSWRAKYRVALCAMCVNFLKNGEMIPFPVVRESLPFSEYFKRNHFLKCRNKNTSKKQNGDISYDGLFNPGILSAKVETEFGSRRNFVTAVSGNVRFKESPVILYCGDLRRAYIYAYGYGRVCLQPLYAPFMELHNEKVREKEMGVFAETYTRCLGNTEFSKEIGEIINDPKSGYKGVSGFLLRQLERTKKLIEEELYYNSLNNKENVNRKCVVKIIDEEMDRIKNEMKNAKNELDLSIVTMTKRLISNPQLAISAIEAGNFISKHYDKKDLYTNDVFVNNDFFATIFPRMVVDRTQLFQFWKADLQRRLFARNSSFSSEERQKVRDMLKFPHRSVDSYLRRFVYNSLSDGSDYAPLVGLYAAFKRISRQNYESNFLAAVSMSEGSNKPGRVLEDSVKKVKKSAEKMRDNLSSGENPLDEKEYNWRKTALLAENIECGKPDLFLTVSGSFMFCGQKNADLVAEVFGLFYDEGLPFDLLNKQALVVKETQAIHNKMYNIKEKTAMYTNDNVLKYGTMYIAFKHRMLKLSLKALFRGSTVYKGSNYNFGFGIFGPLDYYNIITEYHLVNTPHIHATIKFAKCGGEAQRRMVFSSILGSLSSLNLEKTVYRRIGGCQEHPHNERYCALKISKVGKRGVDFCVSEVCTGGFPRPYNVDNYALSQERNILMPFRETEYDRLLNYYNFNLITALNCSMDLRIVDQNGLVNYLVKEVSVNKNLMRRMEKSFRSLRLPQSVIADITGRIADLLSDNSVKLEFMSEDQIKSMMDLIKLRLQDDAALMKVVRDIKVIAYLKTQSKMNLIECTLTNFNMNKNIQKSNFLVLDIKNFENQLFRIKNFTAFQNQLLEKIRKNNGDSFSQEKVITQMQFDSGDEGESDDDFPHEAGNITEVVCKVLDKSVSLNRYTIYMIRPLAFFNMNFDRYIRQVLVKLEADRVLLFDAERLSVDSPHFLKYLRGLKQMINRKDELGSLPIELLRELWKVKRNLEVEKAVDIMGNPHAYSRNAKQNVIIVPTNLKTFDVNGKRFWQYIYMRFVPHSFMTSNAEIEVLDSSGEIDYRDLVRSYCGIYREEIDAYVERFYGEGGEWIAEVVYQNKRNIVSAKKLNLVGMKEFNFESFTEEQMKRFCVDYSAKLDSYARNLVGLGSGGDERYAEFLAEISEGRKEDLGELLDRLKLTCGKFDGVEERIMKYEDISLQINFETLFDKKLNGAGELKISQIVNSLNDNQRPILILILVQVVLHVGYKHTEKGIVVQGGGGSGKTFLLKALSRILSVLKVNHFIGVPQNVNRVLFQDLPHCGHTFGAGPRAYLTLDTIHSFVGVLGDKTLFNKEEAGLYVEIINRYLQMRVSLINKVRTDPDNDAAIIVEFFKLNKLPFPKLHKFAEIKSELNFARFEVIIVDEMSMIGQDVLIMLDLVLRFTRNQFFLPFGGCLVILCGDFWQIPAVKTVQIHGHPELCKFFPESSTGRLGFAEEDFQKQYFSYFFEMKGSERIKDPALRLLVERYQRQDLNQIFLQTESIGSHTFSELEASVANAVDLLQKRSIDVKSVNEEYMQILPDLIHLAFTHSEEIAHNQYMCNLLRQRGEHVLKLGFRIEANYSSKTYFKARLTNELLADEKMMDALAAYFDKLGLPLERQLVDRRLCVISHTVNKTEGLYKNRFVEYHRSDNESRGEYDLLNLRPVQFVHGCRVWDSTRLALNYFSAEYLVPISSLGLPVNLLRKAKDLNSLRIAVKGFQVRPAFAITINMSQGQTLPAISINLNAEEFQPNMKSVALSRVTGLASIFITHKLDASAFRTHKDTQSDKLKLQQTIFAEDALRSYMFSSESKNLDSIRLSPFVWKDFRRGISSYNDNILTKFLCKSFNNDDMMLYYLKNKNNLMNIQNNCNSHSKTCFASVLNNLSRNSKVELPPRSDTREQKFSDLDNSQIADLLAELEQEHQVELAVGHVKSLGFYGLDVARSSQLSEFDLAAKSRIKPHKKSPTKKSKLFFPPLPLVTSLHLTNDGGQECYLLAALQMFISLQIPLRTHLHCGFVNWADQAKRTALWQSLAELHSTNNPNPGKRKLISLLHSAQLSGEDAIGAEFDAGGHLIAADSSLILFNLFLPRLLDLSAFRELRDNSGCAEHGFNTGSATVPYLSFTVPATSPAFCLSAALLSPAPSPQTRQCPHCDHLPDHFRPQISTSFRTEYIGPNFIFLLFSREDASLNFTYNILVSKNPKLFGGSFKIHSFVTFIPSHLSGGIGHFTFCGYFNSGIGTKYDDSVSSHFSLAEEADHFILENIRILCLEHI